MRSPLVWYGGKGALAHRILPLFPPHVTYIEPFAGGASLLFAKPPSPIEVLNDAHGTLVNFYAVLRDDDLFAAFERLCHLTPYSRQQFEACRDGWATETDPLRRAWMFFVAARQSFAGHVAPEVHPTWAYSIANPESNAARRWLSAVDGLQAVHERLRLVQVECRDFRAVLDAYDGADVLWYVDPPYVLSTRAGGKRYAHELTDHDHRALTARLLALEGMVVLSGYRSETIHAPLEAAGWERREFDIPVLAARLQATMRRTESVWRNPAAVSAWRRAQAQRGLFDGSDDGDGVADGDADGAAAAV